ncbi:MAG: hypothetical protein WKF75_18795, partial [Singulisphaera sp.]
VGAQLGNIISGNVIGVELSSFSLNLEVQPNRVLRNLIGTDGSGVVGQGNLIGIFINGLSGNFIGLPGAGNVISGNSEAGIQIINSLSTENFIRGNIIGLGSDGTTVFRPRNASNNQALFQQIGVAIEAASNNTIGGMAAGEGNVIAGNDQAGVYILGRGGSP